MYIYIVCSIIWLCLGGNISSSVGCSYISILPGDNANIFSNFYILSERFWKKKVFLKCKGWSDARVVTITKKEYVFPVRVL